MAGKIRLFEKDADGKLIEVEDAPQRRASRRVARVAIEIDVLFTAQEEAARNAEEAAYMAESQTVKDEPSPTVKLSEFLASNPDVKAMIGLS